MSEGENKQEAKDEGSDQHGETTDPEARIDEMQHGIARVDEEIDEAKEEAKKATTLDPQPLAGTEGEPTSSN